MRFDAMMVALYTVAGLSSVNIVRNKEHIELMSAT